MRRFLRAAAGLAAGALLIIGCAAPGGSGTPVSTNVVDLPPSYRFAPASITITAGETVTWTNNDNFTHNVQFTAGGPTSEPQTMEPGQDVQLEFPTAGTFDYICSLHPQDMRGSVVVTE